MLPDYEIELGRGIGTILFGISKDELTLILGEPDEIEKPDEEKGLNWEILRYDSINCSFSFDADYESRLVEISVENAYFHIQHKIRVGLKKADLLILLDELHFGDAVFEDISDEEIPDYELISYDNQGLNLYLERDVVTIIQIGIHFNQDDSVIWPVPVKLATEE